MNINKVIATGNLTRDPETRNTASGSTILSFSMAVNDSRKNNQTGEWEEYPNFIDCTMFGKRAESLAGILHKGIKVGIVGKLHWSSWERDGQKRSKLDINVDELELLTPKGQSNSAPYEPRQAASSVYDEDIPF